MAGSGVNSQYMNPEKPASVSVSGEVATGPAALGAGDLIRELRGSRCRCGASKQPDRTFCGPCYRALPESLQKGLYKRVGRGYENCYTSAAAYLDAHVRGPL